MPGAELVQPPRIPTVAPDATSARQSGQESRLLQDLHVMGAPAGGRTEVHDKPIRSDGDLGFEGVRALPDAEELLRVSGSPHGLLPRPTAFVLLGLPSEGGQHVFKGTQPTTRSRVVRDDFAAVPGPGSERSRQRLLQEGEQRMNVAADVGGIHLEQHTQEMHGEVMAQVQQGQE